METRQLGNTDLQITRIGFGAWAIGGAGWAYSWGAQDDAESVAAIHRAIDLGINWIDTAAVYGLGHSEEIVAKALEGVTNRPYVFTKCERAWNADSEITPSLKAESIRREVEDSLRRLKVDVIDLYQVHWPQPDEDIEEGWQTMADLKAEGKVRWIGVSNFDVGQMQRASAIAAISSLQPPYSLVKPEVQASILPYCLKNNIGVIVYSPMQAGLLSGAMTRERVANFESDNWRSRDSEFQEPRLTRNLALQDLLGEIGLPYGKSAGEVAIAWTLVNPAVTAAIVGARYADQVDGVVGAADLILSADDLTRIEAFFQANP
ncbi:MAG: aldo/keto reductase [Chitinophagaceae bacterium]|nr:aldo/keto reductase [Anaerolineae bacterium]